MQTVPVKHAAHPPPPRTLTVLGAGAAVAAVTIGAVALLRTPATETSSVRKMTITAAPAPFPVPAADLTALLAQPPDLGPLGDPARRASCLSGLGYPAATPVLGARQVRVDGADAVVFLHRPELAWDAGKVVAAIRGDAHTAADADALIEQLKAITRDGDHVVFMSNGGFDGAPRRFLAAL